MFSFTKNRFAFYTVAFVFLIISIILPFVMKLNLGIDMTGGIQVEYKVTGTSTDEIISKTKASIIEAAKANLSAEEKNIITDTLVYRISGTDNFIVEA